MKIDITLSLYANDDWLAEAIYVTKDLLLDENSGKCWTHHYAKWCKWYVSDDGFTQVIYVTIYVTDLV